MLTEGAVFCVSLAAENLDGEPAEATAEHCSTRCPDGESFGSGVELPKGCDEAVEELGAAVGLLAWTGALEEDPSPLCLTSR